MFFVGGFGTLFDFSDNLDIQRLIRDVYESGGIVSAVCNGPSALINSKYHDGTSFIKGKKVTCYSNAERENWFKESGDTKPVPFFCEDELKKAGAIFLDGGIRQEHVVVDGRLVTGQNPASARKVAETVVNLLKY